MVGLARRIERNEEALAGYAESMTCHLGDFAEYAALRRKLDGAGEVAVPAEHREPPGGGGRVAGEAAQG